MGEASALGRTNNISGGWISEGAEGVATVFAPPAGAKKGLPRLPVMGWRERSAQVRRERHATLGSSRTQRADPKNLERTENKNRAADGFMPQRGILFRLRREARGYGRTAAPLRHV